MTRIILLARRHPDLSMDQFIDHYENVHVPLALETMPAISYSRTYIEHGIAPFGAQYIAPDCDVIVEMAFKTRGDYEQGMRVRDERAKIFADDRAKLMDDAPLRPYFVRKFETEF